MKIYFYHTQNMQQILPRYERGDFPGHMLYGATLLGKYGVDVVWHRHINSPSRLRKMLITTWRVLRLQHQIDALYATHYTGIELLIFLRALHLFRRPIVIWHHQPIITSPSPLRRLFSNLFYKGIDEMFFFSETLISQSAATGKYPREHMHLGFWGADLDYYDRLMREHPAVRHGFVSSGKELRDMPTLVSAFNATGAPLDIWLSLTHNGGVAYDKVFNGLKLEPNVKVHSTEGLWIPELAEIVNRYACVTICCQQTKYTVGLTTVVEALALGLPILCSRNPQIPIDIDATGCGITIPYYDEQGWERAISYITAHPDEARQMGRRGRQLAEQTYNLRHCAEVVASVLNSLKP